VLPLRRIELVVDLVGNPVQERPERALDLGVLDAQGQQGRLELPRLQREARFVGEPFQHRNAGSLVAQDGRAPVPELDGRRARRRHRQSEGRPTRAAPLAPEKRARSWEAASSFPPAKLQEESSPTASASS
jgi:hypothetical protein